MKVYVVCWGSSSQDDKGNCTAYCNVHGVYASKDEAKKGLVECKDEMYDEIVNNPDFDAEELAERESTTWVYGSVDNEYFEIDYESWDIPNEIRIQLVEKEIVE